MARAAEFGRCSGVPFVPKPTEIFLLVVDVDGGAMVNEGVYDQMKSHVLSHIDFDKVNALLEAFNKATGFVTAILDLDGEVLFKSGWREICIDFHRKHPKTSLNCTISDTELANQANKDKTFHAYNCINGLVDVVIPVVIGEEHICNIFSGQFFFEEPDISYFKKQAKLYGFDEESYLEQSGKCQSSRKKKLNSI